MIRGSYLVALGASLWAIDSVFRSRLAGHYSPLFVVFLSQSLCALVVLPLCWANRAKIFSMPKRDWLAFLFLAVASNILAMVAFTYAFKITANYSTPVLIQKIQPFVSIFFAVVFLRETLPKHYFLFSALALMGSLLVGFGGGGNFSFGAQDLRVVLFSLLAAFLWGTGTTVGRFVSLRHSFWLVTSMRYGLAVLFMLLTLPLWWSAEGAQFSALQNDLPSFLCMAYVPGLLALFVYYRGMQVTRATVACWLELAYPLAAVAINWIFLGSKLSMLQIAGAIILIFSVAVMNYQSACVGKAPEACPPNA